MLGTISLALNDNAGGYMGDANGAFGFVYMLSASARRAISIYAQVAILYFDIY
jgi:hypothetical protein